MKEIQKILVEATKKMDEVLPPRIRCVIVLADATTGEVVATSDLPEEDAATLLEAGVRQFKKPAEYIVEKDPPKDLN